MNIKFRNLLVTKIHSEKIILGPDTEKNKIFKFCLELGFSPYTFG